MMILVNAEMVNESKPGKKIFDEAAKLAGVFRRNLLYR